MSLYELRIDRKRKYLQIALHGYWDEKTNDAYEREELGGLEALARLGRPTFCIVDLSDFPPQAKETVERISKRLHASDTIMPSRLAVIVPGALVKMQVDRTVPQEGVEKRVFASREEGEAWLFDEDRQCAVG
ncbi:MAG TPA: hypothetical protein VJ859_13595 [Allosphingosinicella sp.]|nr:hypothetical protein [Allosphingosinicella sp.]